MGGGDLNLKKSWHPGLQRNQEKVWMQERDALAERRKIEQIQKERAEERAVLETQRLHEAAGGKPVSNRVEWMYSGPSDSGGMGVSEEMEGYLLGKSRVDQLLKQRNDEAQTAQQTSAEKNAGFGNAGSMRDVAAKVQLDPMLAMKQREAAAYDAMMNDPTKRRQMLKQAGVEEKDRKHKHRHREDRDRDGHRSKRRRHDDDDRDRRHHRHSRRRSYSPSRSPSPYRSRRYRDDNRRDSRRYDDRRNGRPSRYSSDSRSPSPPRRRYRDDSRSPPRHGARRSPSPYERRRSSDEPPRSRRSPSPPRQRRSSPPRRNGNDSYRPGPRPARPQPVDEEQKEKERAAKLAAMQSNATELEKDRRERLEASRAQEEAANDRDDKVRSDQGRFMNGVRRQADGIDLGESLRRQGIVAGGGDG